MGNGASGVGRVGVLGLVGFDRITFRGVPDGIGLGGAALYFSAALSASGAAPLVVSRTGPMAARQVSRIADSLGWELELHALDREIEFRINYLTESERTIAVDGISAFESEPFDLPTHPVQWVHLCPLPTAVALQLAEEAARRFLPYSVTLISGYIPDRERLGDLIGRAEYVFLNASEAIEAAGARDLDHAVDVLRSIVAGSVVVTSEHSVLVAGADGKHRFTHEPRSLREPTGAGDAFAATFLMHARRGSELDSAVRAAHDCALITASGPSSTALIERAKRVVESDSPPF